MLASRPAYSSIISAPPGCCEETRYVRMRFSFAGCLIVVVRLAIELCWSMLAMNGKVAF